MDKRDSNRPSKDNAIRNPFVLFETPRSPSRSTRNLNPPKLNEMGAIQSSPPRRRNNNTIFSDRYIPNRTGVDLQAAFSLTNEEILPDLRNTRNADNEIEIRREEEANRTFSTVLKAELFGDNVPMATANLSSATANSNLANNRSKTGEQILVLLTVHLFLGLLHLHQVSPQPRQDHLILVRISLDLLAHLCLVTIMQLVIMIAITSYQQMLIIIFLVILMILLALHVGKLTYSLTSPSKIKTNIKRLATRIVLIVTRAAGFTETIVVAAEEASNNIKGSI